LDKFHIFITRKIDRSAISFLADSCILEVWDKPTPPDYETLITKTESSDGLISLLTDRIDRELITRSKGRLRVVSQMAVGVDNIDLAAATENNLPIGHTAGVLAESVADFTFALLLAIARRVVEADAEVHQGIWQPWGPDVLCGADVHGSILGIIGMGRIGQAVAKRARGFEMEVLYYDCSRHPEIEKGLNSKCVDLDTLLHTSDFVSIHANLTKENYHLISKEQLGKMKSSAYLVNTSRGALVDPVALEWALENKIIAGAAVDVTEPEPIPSGSPLLKFKNLVITPHIASASIQTRANMAMVAARNLLAGLNGERLPFCANPEVYS
jgi:glyoxylate reductase